MSREFKFRAWNGVKLLYDFVLARPQFCDLLNILQDEKFACSEYGYKEWKVMQYIGHCDLSGNKIYEGDILINNDKQVLGYVQWNIKLSGYYLFTNESKIVPLTSDVISDLTLIGNIFENPDLLVYDGKI